jgi:hypothetical protein
VPGGLAAEMDEEEKYALGVLLLDECECGARAHRVPTHTSPSSDACVSCCSGDESLASMGEEHYLRCRSVLTRVAGRVG